MGGGWGVLMGCGGCAFNLKGTWWGNRKEEGKDAQVGDCVPREWVLHSRLMMRSRRVFSV